MIGRGHQRRRRRQRRQPGRFFLRFRATRFSEALFHFVPDVAVQVRLATFGPLQRCRVLKQSFVTIFLGREMRFAVRLVTILMIVLDFIQHVHRTRVPDTGPSQFIAPQLVLVPRREFAANEIARRAALRRAGVRRKSFRSVAPRRRISSVTGRLSRCWRMNMAVRSIGHVTSMRGHR